MAEKDLDVFTEPTRVIISNRFSVTKSLQQRIARQYFISYGMAFFMAETCYHLHTIFSGLSFSST